ncbi:hypothetical protein RSAG8_03259, partial [Rhizoctonia solani AG-8 WAC10335]
MPTNWIPNSPVVIPDSTLTLETSNAPRLDLLDPYCRGPQHCLDIALVRDWTPRPSLLPPLLYILICPVICLHFVHGVLC